MPDQQDFTSLQSTPSLIPPGEVSVPKKSSKKWILLPILLLAFFAVIGGGVYAYFEYFQSPEKIIQKMMMQITEVNSFEYSGEVKAELDSASLEPAPDPYSGPLAPKIPQNILVNFSGLSDFSDVNNRKAHLLFNFEGTGTPQEAVSLGFEVKTVDNIVYARLTRAPKTELIDLSDFENQWIKIDTKELMKQLESEVSEDKANEILSQGKLSEEKIQKLKDAFSKAKLLASIKKLPSENIDGQNMYHYQFQISKDGLKNLFSEVSPIITGRSITAEELAQMDEDLKNVDMPTGEIWIGKKDFLLYRVKMNWVVMTADKSKEAGKVSFTLSFKNFDKPVQIDVPAQATPLFEFIEQYMKQFAPDPVLVPMDPKESGISPLPSNGSGVDGDLDGDGFKDDSVE